MIGIDLALDISYQLHYLLTKVPNKQSNVWFQRLQGSCVSLAPLVVNVANECQFDGSYNDKLARSPHEL